MSDKQHFTTIQRKAIERICDDYGFQDSYELKLFMEEHNEVPFNRNWFLENTEDGCFEELEEVVRRYK